MNLRIKETGEMKDLTIIGSNGVEWTRDLLGNNNAAHYNGENEEYEMTEGDFEWWEEYIRDNEKDADEAMELAKKVGINESEIWDRINENLSCDLGDEHAIKQNIFAEIKEEYGIE